MKIKYKLFFILIFSGIYLWLVMSFISQNFKIKEYNSTFEINKEFSIEKDGVLEGTEVGLLSSDYGNQNYEDYCRLVDKFTKIKEYYIGHFDGTDFNKKRCNGYFYIKIDNTDVKFNLTKKEILEKFGKVNFEITPDEYINENGITE